MMKNTQQTVSAFLDAFSQSDESNMLRALPYMLERYPHVTHDDLRDMLFNWMRANDCASCPLNCETASTQIAERLDNNNNNL